jgi:hypothetical protein
MEDMLRDKAFNWSDEEIVSIESSTSETSPTIKKPKYKKKSAPKTFK